MSNYHISIDLGTTTLAFSDNLGGSFTSINHQSAFGADVVSRIKASCEGHGPLLSDIIKKDLSFGITQLKQCSKLSSDTPASITIAANTAMTHLFMNYDCHGLAAYPFVPITLEEICISADILSQSGTLTLLPGVSAFIGGDILSGLLSLDADAWEKPCLLLDLGTNAEMVLGTRKQLLSASAAAGPALEGGGISCGIGGIKGAICHINLDKAPSFQTIDYGRPLGICGTGILDLTAELLSHNYLDETGLLSEPYFSEGYPVTKAYGGQRAITFTQSDVRQIQMAKSAVCTGIELLCQEAGILAREIEHVYLAGTLGTKIVPENAARIGLFPETLCSRIVPSGNTSLAGASLYASAPEQSLRRIKKIRNSITCLELANHPEFQKLFISHMNF
ncbi:MAG: ASKHA domain-containing protein [Acetivibrio ethanolgignens]